MDGSAGEPLLVSSFSQSGGSGTDALNRCVSEPGSILKLIADFGDEQLKIA